MARYGPYLPTSQVIDVSTSNEIVDQIWQELYLLRFKRPRQGLAGPRKIAPWIDQAGVYYQAATKSDWRSGGLLYYYSFLNLAKAYLAANRNISWADLTTTALYHGLSAKPQAVTTLMDFEIDIAPASTRTKSNVFARLYSQLVSRWPFAGRVSVKLREIVPYCTELSTELQSLYGIDKCIVSVLSIMRAEVGDNDWRFESAITVDQVAKLEKHLGGWKHETVGPQSFTVGDYQAWQWSLNLAPANLQTCMVLRTAPSDRGTYEAVSTATDAFFSKNAFPTDTTVGGVPTWQYVPNANLGTQSLHWHPLLSNYLVSFALAQILRYQPHLLAAQRPDSHFARGWAMQSSIMALRWFLMLFTKPALRMSSQ